jgi:hypothetical protein
MRYRPDLGGSPENFAALAAARPELRLLPLPAGVTRFAATVGFEVGKPPPIFNLQPETALLVADTTLMVLGPDGHLARIPLGTVRSNQEAQRLEVPLPAGPLALVRISVDIRGNGFFSTTDWSLSGVEVQDASGARTELELAPTRGWEAVDSLGDPFEVGLRLEAGGGTLRVSQFDARDFGLVALGEVDTVPVLATPGLLSAVRVDVGESTPVTINGADVYLRVVGQVAAVPGTSRSPAALIADLPSLAVAVARQRATGLNIDEHWVATAGDETAIAAQAAGALPGVRVLDPEAEAEAAGRDPYGQGGRTALVIAGVAALLLALIGIGVDVRATARRRVGEFAVLQTMGAGSRLLARAVLAEQGFLAGLGVLVGLLVGVGVAATLAPLVILTPTADRPEPPALLSVAWLPVLGTALALFLAAMALSGIVAATLGRRLAVARLRIGDET